MDFFLEKCLQWELLLLHLEVDVQADYFLILKYSQIFLKYSQLFLNYSQIFLKYSHSQIFTLQGALGPPLGCPCPEEDGIA